MFSGHKVLDLFAGTGVGVAVKQLGATEYGVELMPAALKTRQANNMTTIYQDVWDAHLAEGFEFDTLWASPPCQTFSLAGHGAGRRALDDVLNVIHSGDYKDIYLLRARSETMGDDRIGLVLAPLYYVHRFVPEFAVFEQVPTVLPVWAACADEMRDMGYSVWTGYLHAEEYGVASRRKRAYLIATRSGVAIPPKKAIHTVSMFDALGWGMTDSPYPTICAGTSHGVDRWSSGGGSVRRYLDNRAASGENWVEMPHRVDPRKQYPAWLTFEDAATLMTYPEGFVWLDKAPLDNSRMIGNAVPPLLAKQILENLWR